MAIFTFTGGSVIYCSRRSNKREKCTVRWNVRFLLNNYNIVPLAHVGVALKWSPPQNSSLNQLLEFSETKLGQGGNGRLLSEFLTKLTWQPGGSGKLPRNKKF